MTIVYNTSNTAIALDDFGVTVPSMGTSDISHIRQQVIACSTTLIGYVSNGVMELVNEQNPGQYWSVTDALSIIALGVNGAQVGINKPTRPGIVQGNFYGPNTDDPLVSDVVMNGVLYAIPVDYMGIEFDRIGVSVSNAIANAEIHLGVYQNNNGAPGALLLDAGVVGADTVGSKEIIMDFTTPTDWCFLALWASDPVNVLTLQSSTGVFGFTNGIVDAARVFYTPLAYTSNTALPDPYTNATVTASSDYPPFVWFRSV